MTVKELIKKLQDLEKQGKGDVKVWLDYRDVDFAVDYQEDENCVNLW